LRNRSGRATPDVFRRERDQLVEAIVLSYDRLAGRRAVVYGEPEMVVGLAAMLADAGMVPVLCATRGRSAKLRDNIAAVEPQLMTQMALLENAEAEEVACHARVLKPDLFVGNAHLYGISQALGVPLVLAGWPLDSRFVGARLLHVGYRGGLQLVCRIRSALR
jgi:nitrogenase molybdenum-iron protein NifN